MLAVIGVLIVAVTVLLYTLAVLVARRPTPPAWISNALSMDLIAIALTGGLATGTSMIFRSLAAFDTGLVGAAEGGMILAILIGSVVIWRMLRVRETLAKYDAMMPASVTVRLHRPSSLARKPEGDGPDKPTRPRTTPGAGGTQKKRAA